MKSLDDVLGMEMKYCEHEDCNSDVVLMSLMLTLNRFHILFWCFYC